MDNNENRILIEIIKNNKNISKETATDLIIVIDLMSIQTQIYEIESYFLMFHGSLEFVKSEEDLNRIGNKEERLIAINKYNRWKVLKNTMSKANHFEQTEYYFNEKDKKG